MTSGVSGRAWICASSQAREVVQEHEDVWLQRPQQLGRRRVEGGGQPRLQNGSNGPVVQSYSEHRGGGCSPLTGCGLGQVDAVAEQGVVQIRVLEAAVLERDQQAALRVDEAELEHAVGDAVPLAAATQAIRQESSGSPIDARHEGAWQQPTQP